MAKVIVMNKQNARKYSFAENEHTFAIISINDFGTEGNAFCSSNPCLKAKKHFFFDDVDRKEPNCTPIDEETARDIAKFARYWYDKVDHLVVHCGAGVSRSAGCAAAILKYFTGSDMQIFNDASKHPNMLVYRLVLGALYDTET